jgi:hypothetical protein
LKGWERSYTQVIIDIIFLLFSLEGIVMEGRTWKTPQLPRNNKTLVLANHVHFTHNTLCLDPF